MLTRMPDGSWLDPAKVIEVFQDVDDDAVCVRLENGIVLNVDSEAYEGTSQDLADEIARRINAALRKEDGE